MITTYKLLTNQMKLEGEELFRMGNAATRGHKHKLFKQQATTFVRVNAFSNRILTDRNSFPKDVVEAPTTDVFKERKYITPFNYPFILRLGITVE